MRGYLVRAKYGDEISNLASGFGQTAQRILKGAVDASDEIASEARSRLSESKRFDLQQIFKNAFPSLHWVQIREWFEPSSEEGRILSAAVETRESCHAGWTCDHPRARPIPRPGERGSRWYRNPLDQSPKGRYIPLMNKRGSL